MLRAFIFDTETTGLVGNRYAQLDKQSEILEFAGAIVELDSGQIEQQYTTLVRPGQYPMSPYTIKETKTRLSNAMLATAPPFAEIADRVKSMIEDAAVAIAHNISFDREMVEMEFERLQLPPPQWPRCLCTVEQTIYLKGYRLKLVNLHLELFGMEFSEAHRAGADLSALIRCSVELRRRGLLE